MGDDSEKAAKRRGIEPDWIEGRISERIAARTGRDWALADEIRDELLGNGIVQRHDRGYLLRYRKPRINGREKHQVDG